MNVLLLRPEERAVLIDEIDGLIVVWKEMDDLPEAPERIQILNGILGRLKTIA